MRRREFVVGALSTGALVTTVPPRAPPHLPQTLYLARCLMVLLFALVNCPTTCIARQSAPTAR